MTGFDRFAHAFLNGPVIEKYWPNILSGTVVTLKLAAANVVSGILLGLVLACLRSFRVKPLNVLIVVFADFFRALPPLVLLLFLYFGLPNVDVALSGEMVLYVVLMLVLAAFAEEIFWAGILSVERGQWEAARSTGLTYAQALGYVVLPQAIRLTIPPLTNRTLAITKMTALGTVIGVPEILNEASTAQSFSANASPLLLGAVAYVLLFLPFVILSRWLETRFAWRKV